MPCVPIPGKRSLETSFGWQRYRPCSLGVAPAILAGPTPQILTSTASRGSCSTGQCCIRLHLRRYCSRKSIPMTATEGDSRFLDLPRELRDNIYVFLIHESRPPSEDPSDAGKRDVYSSNTYYERCSPKPALLQLKLCSQQVYAETTEIIAKYDDELSVRPELDIMVKGSTIYPTWTFLPLIHTLHTPALRPTISISLRLFESWEGGLNTSVYRSLWSFFNHLVSNGPCFRPKYSTKRLGTPLKICKLQFVIRLCFPTSVDDWYGTYRDVFDRLERLAMDNVGLGHVEMIEGCFGSDIRTWRLKQLPTGLTFASRV